jgi:charged multivesicular body protein 4
MLEKREVRSRETKERRKKKCFSPFTADDRSTQQHLERKAELEVAEAKKKLAAKNRRGAMMCLKRKKAYEAQIQRLSGARMTLDEQVMAIESANVNLEAMNAMRTGAQTMKQLHKNMSVDQVDDTMAEIQEQMDVAAEISQAISQPIGDALADEDDLEAELEALEQEDLNDKLASLETKVAPVASPVAAAKAPATKTAAMPAAPKGDPDEEAQLRQLEAEMAI